MRTSSVVILVTILFLMTYIRLLKIILAKKTSELVLIFYKNITKTIWAKNASKCYKKVIVMDFNVEI